MNIHQEVSLPGSPAAIYEILTSPRRFEAMTGGRSADIAAEAGGPISLFGGDIRGRNVELVPGRRVVQAWRSQAWPDGVYSIVRFELAADGARTKLTFDQSGHPAEAQAMLEGGWAQMYWDPMAAILGSGKA